MNEPRIISFRDSDEYKVVGAQELLTMLDSLDFESVCLRDKTTVRILGKIIVIKTKTDYDNPFVIECSSFGNTLNINPDYFLSHQDEVMEILKFILANIEKQNFEVLSSALISDEIIDALCKNNVLKKVSLAKFDEVPYTLTKDDYLKLKASQLEEVETKDAEESLKENFDPLISCNYNKNLIGFYTYNDLKTKRLITINGEMSKEELENLKYISDEVEINVDSKLTDTITQINLKLQELNKNNKVIINIPDGKEKNDFNNFVFNTSFGNNVVVRSGVNFDMPIAEYIKFEKQLYDMIKPAMNLSPLEKYIYAYNQVKNFKNYQENEEDRQEARDLYKILQNEFMVCVGFSNMLGDLLYKLGIDNYNLSVSVDTSYDEYDGGKEDLVVPKVVNLEGHVRRYVHIVDEKYGINGFYVADPTWDNDLKHDFYNCMLLTDNEEKSMDRGIRFSIYGVRELFDVTSIQEFYQKINFLLDRRKNHIKIADIIYNLMENIKKLDENMADILIQKYPYLEKGAYNYPKEISKLTDLLYDLGNYIVGHVNKEVSGETIIKAVSEVYRKTSNLAEEEAYKRLYETVEDNKKGQERTFPKRSIIDDSGEKAFQNSGNKFDVKPDLIREYVERKPSKLDIPEQLNEEHRIR